MSESLSKARLAYGFDPSATSLENRICYLDTARAAREWLRSNDRSRHLINIYDNGSDGLLFVFSERDTALMLKLALG